LRGILRPKFVQEYASANDIPVFITQFDTKVFRKFLPTVAARELRYNWFYELLETENLIIFLRHIMPMIIGNFLINLSRNWIRGFDRDSEQNEK
jgi:tRNA(Ile)-lysidine synthase